MKQELDLRDVLLKGAVVGIVILVIFVVFGIIISSVLAWGTVDENEVHVETNWGEATGTVYEQGSYLTGDGPIPNGIAYSTESLQTSPQTMQLDVDEGLTADGQDVNAKVSVTYSLDSEEAHSFYSDSDQSGSFDDVELWEKRIGERAVESAVQDGSSSISALEMIEQYDEDEGADMSILREELQESVEDQLREENEELSPEIDIQSVRIEEVSLSQELDKGFEEIATESTEAERVIIEAEADADADRERAQGQADAFDTIVESYGGVDEALQAEWIEAIDEDEGTMIIDADAAPILDVEDNQDDDGD